MSKYDIPSDEDFERAEAADRNRNKGLSVVSERIRSRFSSKNVHKVFAFYSPEKELFGVYVFYKLNNQIKEAEDSGLSGYIREAVLEELVKIGRGSENGINLDVQFDSDENVQKNYEGDYFLRLR